MNLIQAIMERIAGFVCQQVLRLWRINQEFTEYRIKNPPKYFERPLSLVGGSLKTDNVCAINKMKICFIQVEATNLWK